MSAINTFDQNVEAGLISLLAEMYAANGSPCQVVRAQNYDRKTYPLCIVSASESEEIIFQSGIYRLSVDVTVEADIDSCSPERAGQIYGLALDTLQDKELANKLNAQGNLVVKGVVLGNQKLNDIGDRLWSKSSTIEFFGFTKP